MNSTLKPALVGLSKDELLEHALTNHEGFLNDNGAFIVETGSRTGRSPKDRFIVKDALTKDTVDWGNINQPFCSNQVDKLWQEVESFARQQCQCYEQSLRVGASDQFGINVKTINTYAWHSLFVKNLFIDEPAHSALDQWTLLSVPQFKCLPEQHQTNSDGCVIIDFSRKRVLIAGMRYAGEMKKSFFSVLNFILPMQQILPMHCAANQSPQKDDVSLFFGLSGTGKTTLSADVSRELIGDDEHGWSDQGVFNFEGGCYAKCIDISEQTEPLIWRAIQKHAVLENVVVDKNGVVDYTDASKTSNTRAVYPRSFIPNCEPTNQCQTPDRLIFLCCDLYGVLPPLAKLTPEQAAYYFLSGYTALVGSTEVGGGDAVKPVFSPCFGAVFFPHAFKVYADLLQSKLKSSGAQVYLMNTGWHAGAYGSDAGKRYSLKFTRAILDAVHTSEVNDCEWEKMSDFNFEIPKSLAGFSSQALNPKFAWSNADDYQQAKMALIEAFQKNFAKHNIPSLESVGPTLKEACV